MDKNEVKGLKSFGSYYLSTNKDLKISKEKVQKIKVDSDEKVLSSEDIAKISRNISYSKQLIKECYDYLNGKTLNDVIYYDLRAKNQLLKEYKDKLSVLENGDSTFKFNNL